ncbi:hypothetical protein GC425_06405 [Corynebacterium sp. zg254]|uniref:DUF222 domain-containing protein n=1 Tax=Corynebacterium zhongnanshanii TaxID=2768834 RepID=A0ABQ6VDD8_9CORY|nr:MULTISPECIES: hypothetical protein [Corynebacterium]KAB3520872.1 hypothetical protein F8377_06425 [Corynebacterium zhongnanshanii]MCR5914499.1 hypothetical protein [Corynebacterium sp. zg254]
MNADHWDQDHRAYLDVAPLVESTRTTITDALQRSQCWQRMIAHQLPFIGRAAYLEQHWEGLRVLGTACDKLGLHAFHAAIAVQQEQLGAALDRAHATARWREHHVTMPSMLQFRRRINELMEQRNTVGIAAQAVVRLVAASACPAPVDRDRVSIPAVTNVFSEEDEELFAEELSAAMLMVMAHGSDVCRAYPDEDISASCATTAAAIRAALA